MNPFSVLLMLCAVQATSVQLKPRLCYAQRYEYGIASDNEEIESVRVYYYDQAENACIHQNVIKFKGCGPFITKRSCQDSCVSN